MKFSDDNQLTINDLSFNSDDEINKLDENINKLKVCGSRRNSLEKSPRSPTSSKESKGNGKCGRPANPIPRHKRDSHIKAEHKRRDKIQKGFDNLRELVPALENCSSKESKSSMLFKTAEYCRHLKFDCKGQQDEANALHHEIESLGNQIHALQAKLPAVGIELKGKKTDSLDHMFDKYVKKKTGENWKFWMFSYLVRPLFDTYKKAMEGMTTELFVDTVGKWVEDNMSLISLRPAVLTALRKVSTKTGIMERPTDFKKDVQQIISHLGDVNQNDSTRRDAEISSQNSSLEHKQYQQSDESNRRSPHHLIQVQRTQISPPSQKSNNQLHIDSVMKVSSSGDMNLQISHEPYQSSSRYESHAHHDVMDLHEQHSVTKHNQVQHDVPMTSAELWDISATLPAVDSNSSLSDLIFTHAEERTLYDSILNTIVTTEISHEQMQVQPIPHDLTLDLFPANNTTTTTSSALPLMATGHDQTMDLLHMPSFSDMEMSHTLDPTIDNVTFLLDLDSKDSSMFHSNNATSFPDL